MLDKVLGSGRAVVRVNAQLISTETGANLWSDRFEGEQVKITSRRGSVTAPVRVDIELDRFEVEFAGTLGQVIAVQLFQQHIRSQSLSELKREARARGLWKGRRGGRARIRTRAGGK